jgi:small subunit ribosomal protein S21
VRICHEAPPAEAYHGARQGYLPPFAAAYSTQTEGRVMNRMSEVIIGDGESFEAALRRFNKKIQQAGILAEARRREYYERPAARRKRKEAKRRKR